MAGYIGSTPVPQATQHRETFTATNGQTSFATVGYTPQFLDVYLNGVKLAPADFTATNGSDVILASGATTNDILEVVAYTPFEVANQTFTGTTTAANLTVTGTFTSRGIDDNANAVAITIDSSENVGIGATSPDRVFHVSRSSASVISGKFESASTSGSQIVFKDADTTTNDLQVRIGSDGNDLVQYAGGSERLRIDSSGNVGIGTSSPNNYSANHKSITLNAPTTPLIDLEVNGTRTGSFVASSTKVDLNAVTSVPIRFLTADTERMRITSAGTVTVGKTAEDISTAGHAFAAQGYAFHTRSGNTPLFINRLTSDGTLAEFRKDGSTVGSIQTKDSRLFISGSQGSTPAGIFFGGGGDVLPASTTNVVDNSINLGGTGYRWKDLYLSGGVYLGGTGSANKLDDYETGSWQPQIYYQNATNQSGATNVVQQGTYVKIGKFLHLEFRLDWTAPSGLANDNIGVKNLPFAAANNHYQHAGTMSANFASASGLKFQTPSAGGTTMLVIAGNGSSNLGDDFGSGSGKFIRGTVSYVTQS